MKDLQPSVAESYDAHMVGATQLAHGMHAAFVIRCRSHKLMLNVMFRQSSSEHLPFLLVTWPADPQRHAFVFSESRSVASLGSCKAKRRLQRLWWPKVPCLQPMADLNILGKCQRLGAADACDFVLIGFS